MKKYGIFISGFLLAMLHLQAQPVSYAASTIPENIKKEASVVKRFEDNVFEVTDIDRATLKMHQVFTVLDESGKDVLFFQHSSSSFQFLDEAEIKVFDAAGRQLERYRKKDMRTLALGDGLIDDGKTTYFPVSTSVYPVTVEFNYVIRYKGTLFYPWYHIIHPNQGVEQSKFTVKVPKDLDLRFKEQNITLPPQVTDDGKVKQYTWQVSNMAPIKYEQYAVSYNYRYPSILLAPNRFRMDDYEGDMRTWKDFGYWYGSLIKGLNVLPENKKPFYQQLVAGAATTREKVKIIYQYLQNNFRYVSIQLGIGGFKPFPADFTGDKKYGDCKGLSNYTQAALAAVGIKSYQALINRELNGMPVAPVFPCNQFNHAILMVPDNKDTIWLECTSKTLDFGMLDISTENRNALVVTEEGGVLVKTPATQPGENTFTTHSTITLQADGAGITNTLFTTSGEYREMMSEVLNENMDDQKKFFVNYLGFKQPDEFLITQKAGAGSVQLETSVGKIPEFTAGDKQFLCPRIYRFWSVKLPKAENRTLDFYFSYPMVKTDTTVFKLPAGYTYEALPEPKKLAGKYASYTSRCWYNEAEKAIYAATTLTITQHCIPVTDYPAVKKMFDEIVSDDAQRIVIKK